MYFKCHMIVSSLLIKGLCFLDLSQAEEDVSCYSRVAKFLLACLTRIPTRTCQALLQQVSRVCIAYVRLQDQIIRLLLLLERSHVEAL